MRQQQRAEQSGAVAQSCSKIKQLSSKTESRRGEKNANLFT